MNNGIKPKLKYTVQINYLREQVLLRTSGMTYSIDNSNGVIHALLDLMDGQRTLQEIIFELNKCHEADHSKIAIEMIEALDAYKLLEDNIHRPPPELTKYDLARWSRNINFFGSFCHLHENKYHYQARLKNAKITLLGLGGLGTHLLYDLAAMGCCHIQAVEFDRVEISNLNRQILYNDADLGLFKADLAKRRIADFSKNLKFTVLNKQLASSEDVKNIIAGSDLVICVADRPKMLILQWVNTACVHLQIPLITGGLDTQNARYYSMFPGKSGCLDCWRLQVKHTDTYSDQILEEQRVNELRGDNAAFVSFVAIIAGLMSAEACKIITGIADPIAAGKVHEINFLTMQLSIREQWQPQEKCHTCQNRGRHDSI